ncbi:MAG: hypothetical protein JNK46_16050 [Methylobacteriaceae bacterium]|nr:hypothetical protein [Methylobacteriaceae bacterium]
MVDRAFERQVPVADLPPLVQPQRIFPKELWRDPAAAAVLAKLGIRPDAVANIENIREVMESRLAREKAETARLLAPLNRLMAANGRNVWVRFVTLIAEPVWAGAHREFVVHELHVNPYEDWNLVAVSNGAALAMEGDALMHDASIEAEAARMSAEGLARIEAACRAAGADNAARDAARRALKALAGDIRALWERQSRKLLASAR